MKKKMYIYKDIIQVCTKTKIIYDEFEGIKKFMKEDIILTLGHKFNFLLELDVFSSFSEIILFKH
jgi:hypothetical protein